MGSFFKNGCWAPRGLVDLPLEGLKPSGDLERTPEAVLAVVICLCEVAAFPTPLVPLARDDEVGDEGL